MFTFLYTVFEFTGEVRNVELLVEDAYDTSNISQIKAFVRAQNTPHSVVDEDRSMQKDIAGNDRQSRKMCTAPSIIRFRFVFILIDLQFNASI